MSNHPDEERLIEAIRRAYGPAPLTPNERTELMVTARARAERGPSRRLVPVAAAAALVAAGVVGALIARQPGPEVTNVPTTDVFFAMPPTFVLSDEPTVLPTDYEVLALLFEDSM